MFELPYSALLAIFKALLPQQESLILLSSATKPAAAETAGESSYAAATETASPASARETTAPGAATPAAAAKAS